MSELSRRDVVALLGICLASLMFGLEISSVPVSLSAIEDDLGSGFSSLQWVMNAYTLAVVAVLMAAGTIADRYGRRRTLVVAVVVFSAASLLCGLAPNIGVLIGARGLQGASGGVMLIGLLANLSQRFPDGRPRRTAFAAWGVVFGVGLGFGPIVGAGIIALLDWRWVFLVHLPIAVLTVFLVRLGVEESRDPGRARLDLPGMALLSLGVLGATFFITRAPAAGVRDSQALIGALTALVCLPAFVVVERRSAHPMVDLSVFRVPAFSGALLGAVGMNFSFWPLMIYLPLFFQQGLGYGGLAAGAALLSYTLPTLLVPPLAERLSNRYRPGTVIPLGLFTIGLGFVLMGIGTQVEGASWLTMLPGCAIAGTGLGLTNTPVSNVTTGALPAARAGMASGIDMSARMISLAINIALVGVLFVAGVTSSLKGALPASADGGELHRLAERLAAGDTAFRDGGSPEAVALREGTTVHDALSRGIDLALAYGAVTVWLLALGAFLVFRLRTARAPAVAVPTAACDAAGSR